MNALAAVVILVLCTPYGWVGLLLLAILAKVVLQGSCG